jgi:ferric-dicitrate binding protein FerR (iron transport regulator)
MKMPNQQNSEIENLAEKLLNNTITPEEFKQLEGWYAEMPENAPVWKLDDDNKEQLQQRLFNTINSKIKTPQVLKSFRWKYYAAAASLAIVSTVGILFWQFNHKENQIVQLVETSTLGKITKIHLPDHSIVWLKGNSRLDYPSKFSDSTRNVVLHGEALFEVAKDKLHPFVIQTGKYVARVLGTSFNINENAQAFKLTVLTGKVAVSSAKNDAKLAAPVIVTPGNEFEVVNPAQPARVVIAPLADKALILHGTEYDMNFESISFDDVKQRIEKKFNVQIIADKTLYANCAISADLTDQSLETTLKLVSSSINAKFSINKDQITLTGGGDCN